MLKKFKNFDKSKNKRKEKNYNNIYQKNKEQNYSQIILKKQEDKCIIKWLNKSKRKIDKKIHKNI